ncbi:MAG: ATP-binding cassette domain-containing protein, partial [Paludibacteraceae bacterium]|nr:ATP-binding cassette domain-containing protein [Paludibacteraceae bacterium]
MFSAKNAVVRKELNTILSGINIELAQGELVALVGSAGSGKTTLGQLVSGDIDAYDGEIYVRPSLKRTFVSQQDNFFSMTGMSLTYYGQRYEYSEEIEE